jgi:hypothetical protein
MRHSDVMPPQMLEFRRDMTLRWPCRRGDFILWFRFDDILSGPEGLKCRDFWEMRDGYHVTLTNRLEDMPPWFKLHPTEICDSFLDKLRTQIEKGDYPPMPLDGPNLWRMKTGDRLAWVGADRPDRASVDGILAIVDFRDCALVIGEGDRGGLKDFIGFGSLTTPEMSEEDITRCQNAVKVIRDRGAPRGWGPEWRLG